MSVDQDSQVADLMDLREKKKSALTSLLRRTVLLIVGIAVSAIAFIVSNLLEVTAGVSGMVFLTVALVVGYLLLNVSVSRTAYLVAKRRVKRSEKQQ